MKMNTYLPATAAVFVWLLIYDTFIGPMLLGSQMARIPGVVESFPKHWEIIGDLTTALVLTWFYDRVRGAFAGGLSGGLTFGLMAGVLIHFPTWLWTTLYFGWPYGPVWMISIVLILVTGVSGALIGLVYEKMGSRAA